MSYALYLILYHYLLKLSFQCWLKRQKDALNPDRFGSGDRVMWTSGFVFDKGEVRILCYCNYFSHWYVLNIPIWDMYLCQILLYGFKSITSLILYQLFNQCFVNPTLCLNHFILRTEYVLMYFVFSWSWNCLQVYLIC
jgi:hypothetical protein